MIITTIKAVTVTAATGDEYTSELRAEAWHNGAAFSVAVSKLAPLASGCCYHVHEFDRNEGAKADERWASSVFWPGPGLYTFREWIRRNGVFAVDDWATPEQPEPVAIETREQFAEVVESLREGRDLIIEQVEAF